MRALYQSEGCTDFALLIVAGEDLRYIFVFIVSVIYVSEAGVPPSIASVYAVQTALFQVFRTYLISESESSFFAFLFFIAKSICDQVCSVSGPFFDFGFP